jgi:hypothetical protein
VADATDTGVVQRDKNRARAMKLFKHIDGKAQAAHKRVATFMRLRGVELYAGRRECER